jgi:hypothetical protein
MSDLDEHNTEELLRQAGRNDPAGGRSKGKK